MPLQPQTLLVLVSRIVAHDEVRLQIFRRLAVALLEEPQLFDVRGSLTLPGDASGR